MRASLLALLVGCASQQVDPSDTPNKPASTKAPIVQPGAVGSLAMPDEGQEATTLTLSSVDNKMAFDVDALEAPAGLVRVRFTNNATISALKHNVVIVRKGDREPIGRAAIVAGEAKRFVPADTRVLAATDVAGPDETVTLLVALEPGEYEFFCSYHGHYLMMKGTLTVR